MTTRPFPSFVTIAATALTGLLLLGSAQAQFADQDIPLSAGWNAVWLGVEPRYAEGDTVRNDLDLPGDDETLAAGDTRIGQPKATADVFTNSAIAIITTPKPLAGLAEFFGEEPGTIGTFNQNEWLQWLRSDQSGFSNLPLITGNRPYLIKVDAATPDFTLSLTGQARFFRPTWTADRYNLLGFGIEGTISFEDFFSPASERHPLDKIYSLATNGSWSTVTPADPIEDGVAYWILCDGPSSYMGPVAIDFDLAVTGTLNFGGPGDVVTVDTDPDTLVLDLEELVFTNLGTSPATPTLELITADPGAGTLALHVVRPNSDTLGYVRRNQVDTTANDGSSSDLEAVAGSGATKALTLGALRSWTSGAAGRTNLYRLTPSTPGAAFWLPVLAVSNEIQLPEDLLPESEADTVAGLWIGEVIVDGVTSIVEDGAPVRTAAGSAPIRLLLHSDAGGTVSLLSQVTIMQTRTADPEVAPVPVLVVDQARIPFFEGIKERNGKRVGLRVESVTYDMPRKLDAASQDALLNDPAYPDLEEADLSDFLVSRSIRPPSLAEVYELTWSMDGAIGAGKTVRTATPLTLDPFHRSNPFRHAFHQQHARGPKITRTIEIVFDSDTPTGDRLRGSFHETLQGVTKSTLALTGRVDFRRVSDVATLDTTP